MSELKEIGIRWEEDGKLHFSHVYLKSEADKVIADLIEKNERLSNKNLIMASETIKNLFEEIRHTRCLDNAWWCRKLSNAYAWSASNLRGWKIAVYYDKKAELYRKWRKRWLALAEKFKEAK